MIQQQIKQWREKKFPDADVWDIYRKLLEEVGELAEALSRGYLENERLELGDVGVVLMGIADGIGIDLIEAIELSHKKNLRK